MSQELEINKTPAQPKISRPNKNETKEKKQKSRTLQPTQLTHQFTGAKIPYQIRSPTKDQEIEPSKIKSNSSNSVPELPKNSTQNSNLTKNIGKISEENVKRSNSVDLSNISNGQEIIGPSNVAKNLAKERGPSNFTDEFTDLREKYKILVHNYETLVVDRDSYAEQLQVQSKVNTELKKLLVATMGDDLQIKMECLTNDKVKLAQDIVYYTSQLSNDKEDLDRICIQSDVWRSKFLASSLLIDELVSWRYFLIRQFEEAQKGLRQLTEDHDQYRSQLYRSFLLLQEIRESLEPSSQGKYRNLSQYHTIGDLIASLNDMCSSLHKKLLNNHKISDQFYGEKQKPLIGYTDGEKTANKILSINAKNFYSSSPCDEFQKLTDRQAKLMGYPAHCNFRNLTINCCRKCEGEIKLV